MWRGVSAVSLLFSMVALAKGVALKSFVLGENLHSQAVYRIPDTAAPAPGSQALIVRPNPHFFRHDPKSAPQFELWIENPTEAEVAINLLHFSVLGGPLVLVEIRDAKGVELLVHPPEIYPSADPRVATEEFKLPPLAKVAIRQGLMLSLPPLAHGAKAKWSIWLNGRTREGSSEIE